MNNYAPRPGSAAEAAVEYLRKKGGPARSGEIAEAIGIEAKGISAALSAAVDNGVLVACDIAVPGSPPQKEYRLSAGGKPAPFTLGRAWAAERPAAAPAQPAKEAAKPARKPCKAPPPAPAHPSDESRPSAARKPPRATAKAQRKAAKSLPVAEVPWKAEQPAGGFRCGLFNSGHLELVLRDGSRVEIAPEDTRELCRYLDGMLEGGVLTPGARGQA